jgi:hypothetical protein
MQARIQCELAELLSRAPAPSRRRAASRLAQEAATTSSELGLLRLRRQSEAMAASLARA